MANITIYVPDDLHRKVKAANLPISRLCQEALMKELEQQAENAPDADGWERVEYDFTTREGDVVTQAFRGKYVGGADWNGWSYGIWRTPKGAAVVMAERTGKEPVMRIYRTRVELLADELPPVVTAQVSEFVFGVEYIEELDI